LPGSMHYLHLIFLDKQGCYIMVFKFFWEGGLVPSIIQLYNTIMVPCNNW
jgi:hypothetical protein